MVKDISTDESMKHIQYDDIKSGGSDDQKEDERGNPKVDPNDPCQRDDGKEQLSKEERKKLNIEAIQKLSKQCDQHATPFQSYTQMSKDGLFIRPKNNNKVDEVHNHAHEFLAAQQNDHDNKIFEVFDVDDKVDKEDKGFLEILKDKYKIEGLI